MELNRAGAKDAIFRRIARLMNAVIFAESFPNLVPKDHVQPKGYDMFIKHLHAVKTCNAQYRELFSKYEGPNGYPIKKTTLMAIVKVFSNYQKECSKGVAHVLCLCAYIVDMCILQLRRGGCMIWDVVEYTVLQLLVADPVSCLKYITMVDDCVEYNECF